MTITIKELGEKHPFGTFTFTEFERTQSEEINITDSQFINEMQELLFVPVKDASICAGIDFEFSDNPTYYLVVNYDIPPEEIDLRLLMDDCTVFEIISAVG